MRQVPHYLLIGNGRVAKHLRHYFSLLDLPHTHWDRNQDEVLLFQHLTHATHILLLISDQSIEPFIHTYLSHTATHIIHCSGSLTIKQAVSAHPLTTFSKASLYTLDQYKKIPFIVEKNTIPFDQLLPGLPNTHFYLDATQKAKYHASCVASGNFSCLLWQALFKAFEEEFGLPKETAYPYLQQIMQNLIDDPENALTGPLVRGDQKTIEQNIQALANDPLQKIYQSFVDYYQTIKKEGKK